MTLSKDKVVLICDDEPSIRESIRYAVNKEGYVNKQVDNGISAYEVACSLKPDLIILDVGMPGMNGFDVCQKIRNTDDMDNIIVLILTAHGQTADANRAVDVGANGFMTKPFSPRELRKKLNELLSD